MQGNKALAKKWFEKANNDLLNIENNLVAKEIPIDTICFHAQQAIEKYIKGVLAYHKKEIFKTHDLVKLLADVSGFIPELKPFETEMEKIGEFGIEARYPDFISDISLKDAKASYKTALKIKQVILKKLK